MLYWWFTNFHSANRQRIVTPQVNINLPGYEKDQNTSRPRTIPLATPAPDPEPTLRCVIAGPFPGLKSEGGPAAEDPTLAVLLRSFARHLPADSRLVLFVEERPSPAIVGVAPPEKTQVQLAGPVKRAPEDSNRPAPPAPAPAPPPEPLSPKKQPPPQSPQSLRDPVLQPRQQWKPAPTPLPQKQPPSAAAAAHKNLIRGQEVPAKDKLYSRSGGVRLREGLTNRSPQDQQAAEGDDIQRTLKRGPDDAPQSSFEIDKPVPVPFKSNSDRQISMKQKAPPQVSEEQTRGVEKDRRQPQNLERKRPELIERDDNEESVDTNNDKGSRSQKQAARRVRREAQPKDRPVAVGSAQANVQKLQDPPRNPLSVQTKPNVESTKRTELVSRAVAELLRRNPRDRADVQVVEMAAADERKTHSTQEAARRMASVLKYLQSRPGKQCREVLLSDRVDIAFQADPFAAAQRTSPQLVASNVPTSTSKAYLAFVERLDFIGGDGVSASVVHDCLGGNVLQRITNQRQSLAGLVVGSRSPVLAYTRLVLQVLGSCCFVLESEIERSLD